jgi:hypothetical protein
VVLEDLGHHDRVGQATGVFGESARRQHVGSGAEDEGERAGTVRSRHVEAVRSPDAFELRFR